MSYEIESIERAALEDLNDAATGALAAALVMQSKTVGSAFVSAFGALPATAVVANRTIGFGLSSAETKQNLEAIVACYATARVARYFVHVHPDAKPDGIDNWLHEHGLEEARAWVKFTRGREAPPEVNTSLTIREAQAGDATAFGQIEADAFDLGDIGAPWIAKMVGRPNWHVYMSFEGETPAGAGALYVENGIGWLDWGATAPAFRGRGGQSALLRRRILHALDLGCHLIGTTTGEEIPGDPQVSYKNIVKMGFKPAYVRKNYAPPKTT
jgi:GNAT superfamily N-acetyltransferase